MDKKKRTIAIIGDMHGNGHDKITSALAKALSKATGGVLSAQTANGHEWWKKHYGKGKKAPRY